MEHHRHAIGSSLDDRFSPEVVESRPVDGVEQVARHILESARQAAMACVDDQRSAAADRVAMAGKAAREAGEALRHEGVAPLGRLASSAADGIDRAAGYLGDTDTARLLGDARDLARSNPAIVYGSAFVVGLLLGRFVRSSERRIGEPALRGWS